MPRVPWDELENSPLKQPVIDTPPPDISLMPEDVEPITRDHWSDFTRIGKRAMFGFVAGGLTGATFGFVDVLRDPKALASKNSVASAKIMRFATSFGGFFGTYHAIRMVLKIYLNTPKDEGILAAAACTIPVLVIRPVWRPILPYAVLLVGLDAYNELSE